MTGCYGGFGTTTNCRVKGGRSTGHLSYIIPHSAASRMDYDDFVLDHIATMLTSGRLNNYHRGIIKEGIASQTREIEKIRVAQELIILSPEFHQTSLVQETERKRPKMPPVTKVCKEHKVILHILLRGGCDSFNLLVPHSRCGEKGEYSLKHYHSFKLCNNPHDVNFFIRFVQ